MHDDPRGLRDWSVDLLEYVFRYVNAACKDRCPVDERQDACHNVLIELAELLQERGGDYKKITDRESDEHRLLIRATRKWTRSRKTMIPLDDLEAKDKSRRAAASQLLIDILAKCNNGPKRLSDRQLQVVIHVSRGATYQEITTVLEISTKTAYKAHELAIGKLRAHVNQSDRDEFNDLFRRKTGF